MKLNTISFVIAFLLFQSNSLFAQPGKDGANTISFDSVVYNRYDFLISSAAAGTNTITVSNIANLSGGAPGIQNPYAGSNLAFGDLIMLIKCQGAAIDITNSSSYGNILAMNNVGDYQLFVVSDVSGNTISVCGSLSGNFNVGATERVQVVRIPRLSSLTITPTGVLTASPWNGNSGGIVAIEVDGNVVIDGKIDVSGLGFRGGALNNFSMPGNFDFVTNDVYSGAEKGESIAGSQTDYDLMNGRFNRGAPANGGGGGNSHDAGGGGGANAGNPLLWNGFGNPDLSEPSWAIAWDLESPGFSSNISTGGGRGGYSFSRDDLDALVVPPNDPLWGGDNRLNIGGMGGRPLAYSSNTLFFGGGGGAGSENDDVGGAGGNGGGIIYCLITGNLTGSGNIIANGNDGENTVVFIGRDGPGGGGGGGAIKLNVQGSIDQNLNLIAKGGKGGDQIIPWTEAEGPGGGGGGGFISITSNAFAADVSGGANGITTSVAMTEFLPNGATKGAAGATQFNSSFQQPPAAVNCFPLPVTIISVTAVPEQNNMIAVKWITENEINVHHYNVEVNLGNNIWQNAAEKPAINGFYNTYNISIPNYGSVVYLRIKSTDIDGSISYSSIVQVRTAFDKIKSYLYVEGNILNIRNLPADTKSVSIYSTSGQLIKKMQPLSFIYLQSDISGLASGVYSVKISGKEIKTLKFVKR